MSENLKTMERIIESSNDGIITTNQVTSAGLYRGILRKYVDEGRLNHISRGLYMRNDVWEDELYLFQMQYSKGIYSHDTALYLLGYSDRTPNRYTMTFLKGYNAPSLKKTNLIIKRVVPENYSLGISKINSPLGNPLRIYDLERTLCDILRGSGSDIQIITSAMKQYAVSKDKDIQKLLQYAEQLRVKPKILRYLEVLL